MVSYTQENGWMISELTIDNGCVLWLSYDSRTRQHRRVTVDQTSILNHMISITYNIEADFLERNWCLFNSVADFVFNDCGILSLYEAYQSKKN